MTGVVHSFDQRNTPRLEPAHGIEGFDALLYKLPGWMQDEIAPLAHGLEEIAIDIGQPLRLKRGSQRVVGQQIVGQKEIDLIQNAFSFRADNRAGLEGTLHRIARIINRYDVSVGVRVRFGRFIPGIAEELVPLLSEALPSLMLCGKPGGGKTTLLRGVVEILGRYYVQNTVVVDTSCEIGGDGNASHPALGHITRIQVPHPNMQGAIIMQALANCSPEVIVCDEIGYHDDIEQIQTTSKREVGIVATAHGRDINDILENERLSPLLGNYNPRTRTRSTRPSFRSLLAIEEKGVYRLYKNLAQAIDDVAAGREPVSQLLGPRREAYIQRLALEGVAA